MQTLGKRGFCALPCSFDESRVVVVPAGDFCQDALSTKYAPDAIVRASHRVKDFDESFITAGCLHRDIFSDDLNRELNRCKRLHRVGVSTLDMSERDLETTVADIALYPKIPLVLGGEQNASVPVFKGLKRIFRKLVILHFDSCLDMGVAPDNPKAHNHRTVMRHLFPEAERIVSVGVRNFDYEEIKFARQNREKIDVVMMRDQLRPLGNMQTAINKIIKSVGDNNVYISFDISILDPSTIGTSVMVPEPGGMTYDEVLDIWSKILPEINVVGADFVGFCPARGLGNSVELALRFDKEIFPPSYALAKLIARFISRLKI